MEFQCLECGVTSVVYLIDRAGFDLAVPEYCPFCGHSIMPREDEPAVYTFAAPPDDPVEVDDPLDHGSLTAGERNDVRNLNL